MDVVDLVDIASALEISIPQLLLMMEGGEE